MRDVAGERADEIELQVRVHLAMVTDDREAMVAEFAPAFGLTPSEAGETPHALVGSVDQICAQLVERRERWGISYLGLSQDQLEPFAPVIARLAGTLAGAGERRRSTCRVEGEADDALVEVAAGPGGPGQPGGRGPVRPDPEQRAAGLGVAQVADLAFDL